MINYSDFQKVELRVGKVLVAECISGSDKLLRLEVEVGGEEKEKRQIIAGLGKSYKPEQLLGRQLVFVANLESRQLMGLESQGMILAATNADGLPVVLVPEKEVPSGAVIK